MSRTASRITVSATAGASSGHFGLNFPARATYNQKPPFLETRHLPTTKSKGERKRENTTFVDLGTVNRSFLYEQSKTVLLNSEAAP